jgi:hypothetical protein
MSTAEAVPLPGGGKCLRVEIRAYLHGIQKFFATAFARASCPSFSVLLLFLFPPLSFPFLFFRPVSFYCGETEMAEALGARD